MLLLLVFVLRIPSARRARTEPRLPVLLATAHEVPLPWTGNLNCTEVTPEGLLLSGGKGLHASDGHTLLRHFEDEFEVVFGLHAPRTGRLRLGTSLNAPATLLRLWSKARKRRAFPSSVVVIAVYAEPDRGPCHRAAADGRHGRHGYLRERMGTGFGLYPVLALVRKVLKEPSHGKWNPWAAGRRGVSFRRTGSSVAAIQSSRAFSSCARVSA